MVAAVAAEQRGAICIEDLDSAGKKLPKILFNDPFRTEGNVRDGQCGMRLRAFGEDVVEAMIGSDFSEDVRVVDERPEEINRLNRYFARRNADHGSIVAGVEANVHVLGCRDLQSVQNTGEHGTADFCAASAAPHTHLFPCGR